MMELGWMALAAILSMALGVEMWVLGLRRCV
jgi:hypothetical protein